MPILDITLLSSFFESPYHRNRAPYNEQLFLELATHYRIKIIRPVAWTDIARFKKQKSAKNNIGKSWNGIPIQFPVYYFLPRIGLRVNGLLYFLSTLLPFIKQKQRPDIIYSTWAYPDAYAAMILAKLINRPYVVRVHGSDINDLAKRPVLKNKIKNVLTNAAFVISPSLDLKNKMVSLGVNEKNIHVVYSGVNNKLFRPMDRTECMRQLGLSTKKRILYIGNMKESKGVVDLVKAAQLLWTNRQDFELCLVGKGNVTSLLSKNIGSDFNGSFINTVGQINHCDLPVWINASDCVALPSHNEGVPNVLLEAMTCEKNIVATGVGGIPEIVQNPDRYLVEVADIESLAEKINTLLDTDLFVTRSSIPIMSYSEVSEIIISLLEDINSERTGVK